MIAIRNLVKRYGEKTALDHLDLQIGQGVVFGLLGPNGAGKTTLVSILNGLTDYDEGSVEVFGLPLRQELEDIRRRTAFIPQSLALYENLSVIENLRFFGGIQNIKGDTLRRNIDHAVAVNRLEPMLEQKAGTLSGGQKRRLNIAIGLLNDPEILYFDEPTVGIDPESRNEILDTIRSFKDADKTVIYTSHYMPEIEKICDEVAIIVKGQIIRRGLLETMLQEEKADSVVLELLRSNEEQLHKLVKTSEDIEVIDATTLMLHHQNTAKVTALLSALEAEGIALKQIRYGTTNLESLFIRLTSKEGSDV